MSAFDELTKDGIRALFVIGITQEFFNLPRAELAEVGAAPKEAFADLGGRFGVKVLGTFDDDLLQVGATRGYPFISYILADIEDIRSVVEVTDLVRTPYKEGRLAKYITIDSRLGRPLFFGAE